MQFKIGLISTYLIKNKNFINHNIEKLAKNSYKFTLNCSILQLIELFSKSLCESDYTLNKKESLFSGSFLLEIFELAFNHISLDHADTSKHLHKCLSFRNLVEMM